MNGLNGVKGDWIEGVKVIPLQRISDERGCIMTMLKKTDPHFQEFGEIYFSKTRKEAIKAWHRHTQTMNYCVVSGMAKIVLFDEAKAQLMEIFAGDDNYVLVQIPPMVWNGHKPIGEDIILANCPTMTHEENKMERVPVDYFDFYNWEIKNE